MTNFSDDELHTKPLTFVGAPYTHDLSGAKAAVLGVPFDRGIHPCRIGSRQGPAAIRVQSMLVRRFIIIGKTKERVFEAEVEPIRGEILIRAGQVGQAEAALGRDIGRGTHATGSNIGATRCDKPRSVVARSEQIRRGTRSDRANLRLVHRRVRDSQPKASERTTQRAESIGRAGEFDHALAASAAQYGRTCVRSCIMV